MARRLVLSFLIPTVLVVGILGILSLITDKRVFEVVTWWGVTIYVLMLGGYTYRSTLLPADSLWKALATDYTVVGAQLDRVPMSVGLFGSSDLDDMSAARSFADEQGLIFCRDGRGSSAGNCIRIHWDQIDTVEIVEPDKELVETIAAKYPRRVVGAILVAKVKLRRKAKAMTLVVPWHEQFTRFAPSSVEVCKDWEWPFAVM